MGVHRTAWKQGLLSFLAGVVVFFPISADTASPSLAVEARQAVIAALNAFDADAPSTYSHAANAPALPLAQTSTGATPPTLPSPSPPAGINPVPSPYPYSFTTPTPDSVSTSAPSAPAYAPESGSPGSSLLGSSGHAVEPVSTITPSASAYAPESGGPDNGLSGSSGHARQGLIRLRDGNDATPFQPERAGMGGRLRVVTGGGEAASEQGDVTPPSLAATPGVSVEEARGGDPPRASSPAGGPSGGWREAGGWALDPSLSVAIKQLIGTGAGDDGGTEADVEAAAPDLPSVAVPGAQDATELGDMTPTMATSVSAAAPLAEQDGMFSEDGYSSFLAKRPTGGSGAPGRGSGGNATQGVEQVAKQMARDLLPRYWDADAGQGDTLADLDGEDAIIAAEISRLWPDQIFPTPFSPSTSGDDEGDNIDDHETDAPSPPPPQPADVGDNDRRPAAAGPSPAVRVVASLAASPAALPVVALPHATLVSGVPGVAAGPAAAAGPRPARPAAAAGTAGSGGRHVGGGQVKSGAAAGPASAHRGRVMPRRAPGPVGARVGSTVGHKLTSEQKAKLNATEQAVKEAIQASGRNATLVLKQPSVPVPPAIATLLQRVFPGLIMSRAAYRDPLGYQEDTAWMGSSRPRMVHITLPGPLPTYATDTYAFVVTHPHQPGEVALVFRGSFNDNNYATDFDFQLVPYTNPGCGTNCLVHRGFQAAFDSITKATAEPRSNIPLAISRALSGADPTKVLCTGHSLGGSLATLCGPWASLHYPNAEVVVHTAGSPRVGNAAFASYFQEVVSAESVRLIHNMDPVPNWGDLSNGYVPVGNPAWMVRLPEGNYRVALEDRPEGVNATNADDHTVTNYIAVVTALVGQPNTWKSSAMFAGLPDVAAPPVVADTAPAGMGDPFPRVMLSQGLPGQSLLQGGPMLMRLPGQP